MWTGLYPLCLKSWFFIFSILGVSNLNTAEEIATIYTIFRNFLKGKSNVRVLEIGSWEGVGSTLPIARLCKEHGGLLYCCDAWCGSPQDLDYVPGFKNIFASFWKNMGKNKLRDVVVPFYGINRKVLPVIADKTFDAIYIDGDHHYDGVKFDIEQARRLIKPGGLIAGHDYEENRGGVVQAVNEAFGKPNSNGVVWWVTP